MCIEIKMMVLFAGVGFVMTFLYALPLGLSRAALLGVIGAVFGVFFYAIIRSGANGNNRDSGEK